MNDYDGPEAFWPKKIMVGAPHKEEVVGIPVGGSSLNPTTSYLFWETLSAHMNFIRLNTIHRLHMSYRDLLGRASRAVGEIRAQPFELGQGI